MTYSDAGCRYKADGQQNTAVVLFCGGMFAGRWLGTMFDVAAQKIGVRIISVDRPGMGGTPCVDIRYRVQTWLEIVPALLDHLCLKHVSVVSHSAGTIYLINTLLHLRHILHPIRPYVAMLAPWIHHSDTSSTLMSLTNMAPCSTIGNFHNLTSFMMASIMPSVGPMFTFSGNMAARIGSSFPSAGQGHKPNAATYVMQPGTASEEELNMEKELLSELRVKYVLAEGISGGSQEALLCLKRPTNHWGSWENYDKVVPLLAANEEVFVSLRDGFESSGSRQNLRVDIFYAENDKLTNGKRGSTWFDKCWSEEFRGRYIDVNSLPVAGQSHESLIDPDIVGGPIEGVFMEIAKQFKVNRGKSRDHTPNRAPRTSFYSP